MRSRASPAAICSLASRRWISETTAAHCNANAALLPTLPPPPMIETFMTYSLFGHLRQSEHRIYMRCFVGLLRRRHDLIGDYLDELLDVVIGIILGRHRSHGGSEWG